MIISESNSSSRLQNDYLISIYDVPKSLSEYSTFIRSEQFIDPFFLTKDHIIFRKTKSCRDNKLNNHNTYSKYSVVFSDCSLSLTDKKTMTKQTDYCFRYSYASAESPQETSKNIVEVEDILKNERKN